MNRDKILNLVSQAQDLPTSISDALVKLYGKNKLSEFSFNDKKRIRQVHEKFFNKGVATDYSKIFKEYAIYYLPTNFYKIWRPLCDLLEKSQINNRCNILELGCGPGSTTFGFIEFYKILAEENPTKKFELSICVVEQVKEFLMMMKEIYYCHKETYPLNLEVKIYPKNQSVEDFFSKNITEKFDYIIESNMINPNESLGECTFQEFSNKAKGLLKSHASIILIEPAEAELSKPIKELKRVLMETGMTVYSPCSCQKVCNRLAMARVDISNISLLNELVENNIIPSSKIRQYHNFEYAIFRNDGLQKYEQINNAIKFSNLSNHVNEKIKFKAYVLIMLDKDESYRLKICDGDLDAEKEVWLDIPKIIFDKEIIKIGRGGLINVKNARVISDNQITCSIASSVNMEI